ncbi:MAG: hypothetical protein R3D71_06065 [Rickettsiales bacterium]
MYNSIASKLQAFTQSGNYGGFEDNNGEIYLCSRGFNGDVRLIQASNGKFWDLTKEQFNGLFNNISEKEAA